MKSLNSLMNIFFVIDSFLFSLTPILNFHKQLRYFFPAIIISSVVFIVLDVFFTNSAVWSFNDPYIIGIYFVQLAIEEVLFLVNIPFSIKFNFNELI